MVDLINGSTFITDSLLFVRDVLRNNVSDPLSRGGAGSTFVFTSYPQENIKYPIITVRENGFSQIQRGGMQSETSIMNMPMEIRIWSLSDTQKDQITQDIFFTLKDKQFGAGSTTTNADLHDFNLTAALNIDEEKDEKAGNVAVKSKIMNYTYMYINV